MFQSSGGIVCKKLKDTNIKLSPATLSHFPKLIKYQKNYLDSIQQLLITTDNAESKLRNELTEISKELNAIDREKIVEYSRQHQLLDSSYDLRLLRNDLRSAWVTFELLEQKRNKAKSIEDGRKRKEQEMIEWRLMHQKAMESLAREQEEERQKKFKLMNALKKQISELEQRRNEEKQANLKEKEEMQQKLKALAWENQAERERLKKNRLKLKQEMDESLYEIEEKKKLQKIERMSYTEISQPCERSSQVLNDKLEKERRRIRQERLNFNESMGYSLLKKRKEEEARDELLKGLLIEERNNKENEAVRKKIAKHNEARLALRKDLEFYHNVIKPQKEAQLREQNRLASIKRQMYLDEFDRTMKMNADKQQQKDIEYLNSLKKHIKNRRLEIAQAKAQAQKEEEVLIAMMKERDKLVHSEAIRLIKSQPPGILRFVSKRMIKYPNLKKLKLENIS